MWYRRQRCPASRIRSGVEIVRSDSFAELGNREATAYFMAELVRNLGMTRYGFDLTRPRVHPQRVRTAFTLEMTAMAP